MSASSQPTALLDIAQLVNVAVIASVVAVLARRWRDRKAPATACALAMFSLLGLVVCAGLFKVEDNGSGVAHVYTVVLVCLLLLVPYFLVRFTYSLGALGRRSHQVAAGLTVAQLVLTVFAPSFPRQGDPRSTFFVVYVGVVVSAWTIQSLLSAVGLWRAGRGQPSVVRHRMRVLSLGAMVIALDLVASAGSGGTDDTARVITTLIGVVGICLLAVAFVVPAWLRSAWRAGDLVELGAAERRLMTALTPEAVALAIVPAVMKLFGADCAALLDSSGRAVVAQRLTPERVAGLYREILDATGEGVVIVTGSGAFACSLSEGWIVVQAGAFAPLFGPAELALLDRVSSFADLALQRCTLFEQEARSRAVAEAANAELQTLVYSVSHDLRSPIISVLGYLDVLAREHAGELQGEGPHYLDRISVNALYMQSLIQDLLELSRIGRSEPASQEVPVDLLAESVAQEVRVANPACDIAVTGTFPVLWMSELRVRQLLTNLIDNAAKHARGEATVTVQAERAGGGGAVILIADNGPGIPAQHRDKAFDVFERLDAAHRDVPGTGMGLPICRRIVESVGGTITLEGPSSHQLSGTTVRVALPATIVRSWTTSPRKALKQASG